MILKPINIINGTNTDVGKTYITCKVIKQNKIKGKKINAIKPIISGFDCSSKEESDAGKILEALEMKANLTEITKYFLKEPASPNIAAKMENIKIDYEEVLNFSIQKIESSLALNEPILIEMSGGICSPITETKTMLDLTFDLNRKFQGLCNNIIVTSNYLGGISHTITACKVFEFDQIIFNPFPVSKYDDLILNTMESLIGKKIIGAPGRT